MDPLSSATRLVLVLFLLAGATGVGFFWWRKHQMSSAPTGEAVLTNTPPRAPMPADAASAPAPPAIRHPLTPEPSTHSLPALAESDATVEKALAELLGRPGLSFLQLDGFVRRVVVTVDNLANDPAPVLMWPVKPTGGRFEVEPRAGGSVIASRNSERYAPFIRFVAGVDTRRAVVLYSRLYPLFQRAYEELGYSGKYFNDRAVAVIDDLLATPELPGPLAVKRVQTEDVPEPPGAAGLYQFKDPALEGRSAGQKIMLRIGPVNASTLKGKLAELRSQIATGPGGR